MVDLLLLNPDDYVVAVDIGGTKTAVALVSSTGEIVTRLQETTSQEGPTAGIAQITRLINDIIPTSTLNTRHIGAIGIGIPAVVEHGSDHIIWAPNLAGWRDVALRPALEAQLSLPVKIEYDGHTAVLGEWWVGAGVGYENIVDVIIGTGIGSGIIFDGRLARGHNRLAGAAGWFAMTTQAQQTDYPGHDIGHWESLAAGPGIVRRARLALQTAESPLLSEHDRNNTLTAKTVFSAAQANDPVAMQIVTETAEIIGLGVANIVSLINPEMVILGGSIGSRGDLLLGRVQQIVNSWAQPISAVSVKIVSSQLGADAGLLGAAFAALTQVSKQRE